MSVPPSSIMRNYGPSDLPELFQLYPQCPKEAATENPLGYFQCIRQEQLIQAIGHLRQEVEQVKRKGSFLSGMVIGGVVGAGVRHLFTVRGVALLSAAYILRKPLMKAAPMVWKVVMNRIKR